jgi:hypothetical protein
MTLTASGNVGIGTSSPGERLYVVGTIVGQSNDNYFGNYPNGAYVDIGNLATSEMFIETRSSSLANVPLNFRVKGAAPITFSINSSERARIDSSGNLLVGTTNSLPVSGRVNGIALQTAGKADIRNSVGWNFGTSASSGIHFYFYTDNGSTFNAAGQINSNGSTTSYVTSSDYRLKENVQPLTNALSQVSQLRPVVWKWKDGVGGTNPNGQGFIAHELQEVVPDCVTGTKDAVDKDGKPQYQGVDTSFLVATLVAALQEQQDLIQDLTNRLTALEGN